ncbi:MAG TPA: hypothetical protein VGI35_09610, partial [Steroidobacteraceae bacterium]
MAESAARGFTEQRLRRVAAAIEEDVRRRRYFGAVIAIARGGRVGLFEAIGHADPDARRPL